MLRGPEQNSMNRKSSTNAVATTKDCKVIVVFIPNSPTAGNKSQLFAFIRRKHQHNTNL